MPNFQLPIPAAPLVLPGTGTITSVWYRFFVSLFQTASSGQVGSATQVLHGGIIGYAAVDLTTDVTGILPAANARGLTGDVTSTSGSVVTTIAANTVTNAKAAQMPATTIKGNNTGGTANALDLTAAQTRTMLAVPQQTTGSWTPADNSGAALTFTSVSANYTQIGNMVFAYFKLTYPVTISGASASISGLPVAVANADYATAPSIADTTASITGGLVMVPVKNTTTANFDVGTPVGPATNAQLSGATVAVMLIYPAA